MKSFLRIGALALAGYATVAAGTAFASGAAGTQCRDGNNRRVTVINNTRTQLNYLYGSNVNRNSWEEDVLGNRVLPAGRSITVNWDDGTCMCNFDFKAVFADGEEVIRRNYNVCTGSTWTITGN